MGLFSDADVNRADEIIERSGEFDKKKREEFIDEFLTAWGKCKGSPRKDQGDDCYQQDVRKMVADSKFIKKNILMRDIATDPKRFGRILGTLVGTLKYHSAWIVSGGIALYEPIWAYYINGFKSCRPFYDWIIEIAKEWKAEMIKYFEEKQSRGRAIFTDNFERFCEQVGI